MGGGGNLALPRMAQLKLHLFALRTFSTLASFCLDTHHPPSPSLAITTTTHFHLYLSGSALTASLQVSFLASKVRYPSLRHGSCALWSQLPHPPSRARSSEADPILSFVSITTYYLGDCSRWRGHHCAMRCIGAITRSDRSRWACQARPVGKAQGLRVACQRPPQEARHAQTA